MTHHSFILKLKKKKTEREREGRKRKGKVKGILKVFRPSGQYLKAHT